MISAIRSAIVTVHPHVRGDGVSENASGPQGVGSPPRAWGRLLPTAFSRGYFWFTPTCVGTATMQRNLLSICPVHPHVRGDGSQEDIG